MTAPEITETAPAPGETCRAVVGERPHYYHYHDCDRVAIVALEGIACCGVHARVARKWNELGPGRMAEMVDYWWDRCRSGAGLRRP